MHWFLIALAGPALFSISNHIDKYLLSKYFKSDGVGALIIFSSLIGLLVVPFIGLTHPQVVHIPLRYALIIVVSGLCMVTSLLLYLYALDRDEASIVVPLYQTVPVFAYLLGYFVLGEQLTSQQLLGAFFIVLGGFALSLDLNDARPKLKGAVLILMLSASFLIAASDTIFKFVALEESYWTTSFWQYIGETSVGIGLFIFVGKYRRQFINLFKANALPIIGLNVSNEVIYATGVLIFKFAILLAPLALVQSVNGFQPVFVLFYGVLLTLFFPRISEESLLKRHLIQKIACIAVILFGTYLLNI